MAATVTFTQETLFSGAVRAIGSTLSVSDQDAQMLVDLGVATAPGLTPQIGSVAGALISGFAPLGSPALTGTPTAPTAANGTNTTQIATTAFVTAAVPVFATTVEAQDGDITNKVMSPRRVRDMLLFPGYVDLLGTGSSGTSGAGASTNIYGAGGRVHETLGPNVGVAGFSQYALDTSWQGQGILGFARGNVGHARNWAKKIGFSGRGHFGYTTNTTFNGDANSTIRISLGGKISASSGDILTTEPGFGFKFSPGGQLQLVVSRGDGSALSITNTGFTPVAQQVFDWKLESDGSGNIVLYINDSQIATASNGPIQTSDTYNMYFEQVDSTVSTTARCMMNVFNAKLYWSA